MNLHNYKCNRTNGVGADAENSILYFLEAKNSSHTKHGKPEYLVPIRQGISNTLHSESLEQRSVFGRKAF